MKAVTGHLWAKWNENSNDERKFETLTWQTETVFFNLLLEVQSYVKRKEKRKTRKNFTMQWNLNKTIFKVF